MIRFYVALALLGILLVAGCDTGGDLILDDDDDTTDPQGDDDDDLSDDDTDPGDGACDGYTFTMVDPQDGATDMNPLDPVVFEWNYRPPDAYQGLRDDWGNAITTDHWEAEGPQVVSHYPLEPYQTYHFEAGWFCFEEGDEQTVTLIDITFTTGNEPVDSGSDDSGS